jgi:hypothetical protein
MPLAGPFIQPEQAPLLEATASHRSVISAARRVAGRSFGERFEMRAWLTHEMWSSGNTGVPY